MANSKIYLKSEAGGTTVVSRDTSATSGNLVLPASGNVASVDTAVTDNAIARYDGATGKLQNSSATIDDNGNIGTGTQTFNGFGGSGGFKNYIINGNFDIWQRGTSFLNISNALFCADRWFHTRDGTGATVNINSGGWIPGSVETGIGKTSGSILEFQQTVAGTGCNFNTINQRLENIQWSSQKTMTLSFNCSFYTSTDTIKSIVIRQNFGIGGSAFVDTAIATNVSVGVAWEFKSFTFTLPSISGKTIGTNPFVELIIFLPQNKVFQFRLNKVQLEEGSVATPFEQRPYGLELSLCQRYFRFGNAGPTGQGEGGAANFMGAVFSGSEYGVTILFDTEMRINPTIIATDSYNQSFPAGSTAINSSFKGITIRKTANSTANSGRFVVSWTASAEL